MRAVSAVSLLASIALACGGLPSGERAETLTLAPGATYPRALDGDGPRRFRFTAEAGRLLHLDVEQRGVDVVVLLRDPAGRLLFEVDGPDGKRGTETVLAVTPVSGEYLLAVEPLSPEAKGDFTLTVREVRPAGEEDRVRAAAAAALARAERRRLSEDFPQAAVAYREAIPLLEACGRRRQAAEAQWHLGEALLENAELRQAAAVLERAAARFRGLGDRVGEARALNDLGAAWRILGEPERALAAYRHTLRLYRSAGVARGEATARHNIGRLLEATGDLQGAILQYETALASWRRLGSKSMEAATLQALGGLYALIGHDDEALDLLGKALDLLAGEADERRRTSALIALGWAQYLAGRHEEGLGRFRQALALAERTGDRLDQAAALDRQGSVLREMGRYDEAAGSYERSLDLSRAAGSRYNEGHTLANLGWLDLETGAVARGRRRLRQAVDLLTRSGDPNGEAHARIGLSRAERKLGAFGPAREQAEAALRLGEEMRLGLRGSRSRGQFLATRFDAYEELATLLMELDRREPAAGHAKRALEVAERARARNLLEEMRGSQEQARPDSRRSRSLRAEVQALDERRQTLAARDPRDPRLRELDAALRARWLELDRLTVSPRPEPAHASLTAAEIQAAADDESVLIVYLLAEPASFAWTVDRQGVESHVLAGKERIEKLARRVVAAMPRSHELAAQRTAERAARELSREVVDPLAGRLAGRRRLVILTDGALHLVPFAALPAPAPEPGETDPRLLDRHEIVRVPSVTVLLAQRRRLAGRPAAPGAVAALADPLFSLRDERLSGVRGASAAARGPELELAPLERLPFSAREAESIVRLVPRQETLLAIGPEANRDLVLSGALRGYRIVHFATHGFLHPVLPERSGLVLSRFDAQGRRREGVLSAPDVAGLDLPADLVVLSACETGLGRELRGEGLVGLNQAFFRAGARRVVVSTWKVRDRATAELMTRFYHHLLTEGLSPAAALRSAQLAIRDETQWRSPYFWAGFSLHGDWR